MNLLAGADRLPRALLALEDGSCYAGQCCGAEGEAFGELVFNTSMTGYQEIVTDPSYAGQIVTLTYPQVGNYGVTASDGQAAAPALRALVVRDMCFEPSNWQSVQSLPDYLRQEGVVAIQGVDTRALTLRVREAGAMRAAVSTTDLDPRSLVARVRASAVIGSHNHVADVSVGERTVLSPLGTAAVRPRRVVAYDCGMKRGIADALRARGLELVVVPWDTPAEEALALGPDAVFLSNGPGDPQSVGATLEAMRALLGRFPVFGICLGTQVMALAAGGSVKKLPYGHHGGNEPVMNLLTGRVEVTAQNHNYVPDFPSLGPLVPELSGGEARHHDDLRHWSRRRVAPVVANGRYGRIRLTHVNLNDGSLEGLQFLDARAFCLQYHPEAAPGPSDSSYAFDAFRRLVDGEADYLAPAPELAATSPVPAAASHAPEPAAASHAPAASTPAVPAPEGRSL